MRPKKKFTIFFGLLIVMSYGSYAVWYQSRVPRAEKPHIIVIVADDIGWNDVSFHGADQIPTPNIDALAYNGVILNRHYVLPTCTPSSAALLTGRYPVRDGMQGRPLEAGSTRALPLNLTLMPEHMRRLGYETRLLGKWHLGYRTENHTPARRGFDSFFGYYNGFITYFNKTISQSIDDQTFVEGYDLHRDDHEILSVAHNNHEYFTDSITNEAVRIIEKNNNEKPLFLEIAHLASHSNGMTDRPLEVRDSAEVDKTFAYIKDSGRRKYAGVIKALDESVGQVVQALSRTGMLDNSIIVFMSDNGAPTIGLYQNFGSNYPFRGLKNTLFEGGVRGAACVFSPLIEKPWRVSEEYVHMTDWLPTLYSAAGGNISDLGEIDGYDQWRSLVYGFGSPRNSILINIDERSKMEAAIIGKYKLVKDAVESNEDYYGDVGNDPSYPKYDVVDALNSMAGQAIEQLPRFISVADYQARTLRESAVVKCQRPVTHKRCLKTCLFDIVGDPCETKNLSNDFSVISTVMLHLIKYLIKGYRDLLLPQSNGTIDSCSFPEYFDGVWMPWRKDDGSLINPASEGSCRNFSL